MTSKHSVILSGSPLLVPSQKTKNKPRIGKSFQIDDVYYMFSGIMQGSYPLELYIRQCREFDGYSVVILPDTKKEVWLCVFNGSIRQTIAVPNNTIETHLRRLAMTEKGMVALFDHENIWGVPNITNISNVSPIKLHDPAKDFKNKTKLVFLGVFGVGLLIFLSLSERYFLSQIKNNETRRLSGASIKNDTFLKELPSDKFQENIFAEINSNKTLSIPVIINGGLSWQ